MSAQETRSFQQLEIGETFRDPNGQMCMKFNETCIVPVRYTHDGGFIGYGSSFEWRSEWNEARFAPLEESEIDTFIRENTVQGLGLSTKEKGILTLILLGGISLLGGIVWFLIWLSR